jgi:hypothetical protein
MKDEGKASRAFHPSSLVLYEAQLRLIVGAWLTEDLRWARRNLYALLVLTPLVLGMTYFGVGAWCARPSGARRTRRRSRRAWSRRRACSRSACRARGLRFITCGARVGLRLAARLGARAVVGGAPCDARRARAASARRRSCCAGSRAARCWGVASRVARARGLRARVGRGLRGARVGSLVAQAREVARGARVVVSAACARRAGFCSRRSEAGHALSCSHGVQAARVERAVQVRGTCVDARRRGVDCARRRGSRSRCTSVGARATRSSRSVWRARRVGLSRRARRRRACRGRERGRRAQLARDLQLTLRGFSSAVYVAAGVAALALLLLVALLAGGVMRAGEADGFLSRRGCRARSR